MVFVGFGGFQWGLALRSLDWPVVGIRSKLLHQTIGVRRGPKVSLLGFLQVLTNYIYQKHSPLASMDRPSTTSSSAKVLDTPEVEGRSDSDPITFPEGVEGLGFRD